ncbi:hypothetical protein SPAN111604_13000 [Sphingomonas antarctica]
MSRLAISVKLPVSVPVGELSGQSNHGIWRPEWIVPTVSNQYFGAHWMDVDIAGSIIDAVETDYSQDILAGPGKVEDAKTPKTISNCREGTVKLTSIWFISPQDS